MDATEGAGCGAAGSGSIGIVGAGSIGVAFALVFARAGMAVRVHDPAPARLAALPDEVAVRLAALGDHGLAGAEEPGAVLARISSAADLGAALDGAALVQECAPEDLDLKRALFAEMDRLAPAGAVLASSSSFLPASRVAAGLPGRSRCLVGHPGNPPYLVPVIEVVPAPSTAEAATARAVAIYAAAGLSPVRLGREAEGFAFNRLQGAVLREAYCLVRDGIATVDDVDRIVRDGLGLRWSVAGPFETADLNTRGGIAAHAARMGPAYARMGAERGQHDPWTGDLVAAVAAARRARLPLDRWDDRVLWRDRRLMESLALRRDWDATAVDGDIPPPATRDDTRGR